MQRAEIAVTPVSAAASTERARGLPATQTPRPNAIPSAATTPIPSAATEPVVAVPSRPTNATETAPPSRVSEKPLQVPPAETAPAPSAAPTKPALQNPVPSSRAEIATTPWPAASTVATPPAPRAENLVPTPTNPTPPTNPLAENSPAPIAPAAPTPTTPHGTAAPIGSSAIPNQTSSATPPPTAAPTPMPARNVLPNPPAPERAEIAKASATAVAPTATTEAAPSTTKSTTAEPATKPAPAAARGEILPRQPARQQTPAPTPTAAPARLPAPAAAPARSSLPVFIPSAAAFLARAQSPAVPGPLLPVSNPRWLQTSAATASPILPATRNDLTITAPSATRANSQLPPPVASRVESLNAQTISPRTAPTIAAPAISAPAVAATPRLAPAPVIPPPGAAPFTTSSNLTKTLAPLPFATRDAELIAVEWVDLEAAAGNEIMVGSTSAAVAFAADTATSTARPTGIAEFSSPPTVELFARPARNRNSDASRAPGATTPSGTGATIAGANSARSSSTTEQRVILEFRDPAGALFRIISEPETWLAVGSELLPGWRHANLAGADRQEIPTGTALPGNARPSTEAAGENPAGSENRGQRQFSPDARGEFAELSARPVNARGLETAVHPAFTGFGHVPLTNEPEPRLTNSLLKIASVEKTADAAVAHPGLGTTTAPQHSNMNTADAGNQSAPRPEKSLPLVLGFAGTPDSPALPGQWKIRRESRPFAAAALATDPALAPWTARATSDPRDLELAAAPPLPEPTRVPMEKVQTLISRELNLVRQLGADALAIVLKPDSRTELFLQISHHNGKTEALIRCERGDFEHLQKNWAQLQNTLAGQQVTLAPLQRPTLASQEITDRGGPSGTTSFSGNTDTGTGQHPQRQPEHAPRSLDELPLVGSLTEPFKRRSTNRVTTSTTAGATAIATNKTGLERWA